MIAPGIIGFLQDDLGISLTLAACLAIMLRATQKRRHFALRLAITQLAFLGAVLALNAWIGPNPIPTKLVPVITKYTLILCIAVWGVMFCYEAAIGAALINVATAFCVEHIAQRVKSLVLRYLPHDKSGEIALLYALTAVFVFLFWRVFEKPIDRRNNSPRKTGFLQVFVSVAVVCTDIIYSFSFIYTAARTNCSPMVPFGNIASVLFSLLALVISYCHVTITQKAYDLAIIRKMQSDERIQYRRDQSTVDLLNLKAHDLKHQLSVLSAFVPRKEIDSLYEAVQNYDAICNTGNTALDAVLTGKSRLCLAQNITFTHMADGSALAFMEDHDIYSLFGNMLDNAINAVEQLAAPDERLIGLTVSALDGGMLLIHEENFFAGRLAFQDGLPQTTQADRFGHGYGMKSMQLLVKKYGGTMQLHAQGHIFSLDILIPAALEAPA